MPADSSPGDGARHWLPAGTGPGQIEPARIPASPVCDPAGVTVDAAGRVVRPPRPSRLWVNGALYVATVLTTSFLVSPVYSACLMAILTAHEFGHYLAARHYGVPASLPYFLPAPFFFGTFGAFIRMSPQVPDRRALFDIAAAGPLAGAVLALPITFVGILQGEIVPIEAGQSTVMLGDSLLMLAFERVVFGPRLEGTTLLIGEVGFAGWVGLFVTGLNLLPIGQLDGGHVSYAVFRERSVILARVVFGSLAVVCVVYGLQFLLMLILLYFMGIRHRPTMCDSLPLGPARRRLAAMLAGMFVVCFVPVPVTLNP